MDVISLKCISDIQVEMLSRPVDVGVGVAGRELSCTYTLGVSKWMGLHVVT